MAGWPPEKNTAFVWEFYLRDADGDLIAGAADLDVEYSIDGGVFADVAGTEVDEGEGLYSCPISAGEMNGDRIALICKTSTGGIKTAGVVIYTSTRQIDDLAYPTTTGRSIQVESDGMVHGDLKEWLGVAPLALVSQRVNSSVGVMVANVITASALATDAVNEIRDAILSDSTSFPGASITEVRMAALTDWINGGRLDLLLDAIKIVTDLLPDAGALNDLATILGDTNNMQTRLPAALVSGRMDSEVQAAGFAQGAADKVWSSATRTLTAFSTALALNVWHVLEASIVTANTIGLKIKTNLDALISSRSSHNASDVTTDMDANSVDFNSLLTLITAARMGALDDWIDGGRLDALIDAIKAKTDTLPSGPAKNVALANFGFLMVLSSDDKTPGTVLTVTGQVSIDGGAFAGLANAITEIGNGLYKVNLDAAELNGDVIILKFIAATANQRTIAMLTT